MEEAPTKVVKVATTVARRMSAKPEENKVTTPAAKGDDLHLAVLEESFRSVQPGYEGRSVDACRFCCSSKLHTAIWWMTEVAYSPQDNILILRFAIDISYRCYKYHSISI